MSPQRSGTGGAPREGGPSPADLTFAPVDPARWADFERLFEMRGAPKSCWCMFLRKDESGRKPRAKADRKRAMEGRIRAGVPVGILAYDRAGEPVAWCSVAPRETLARTGGVEEPGEDPARVWAITCFYVPRQMRRRGMMARMIEEAAEHARRNGAASLEAYPVAPDSPSYRFCGFVPVFAAHGFVEVGRAGLRRHVMRRDLR